MSNAHLLVQEDVLTKAMILEEEEARAQRFTPNIWVRLALWLMLLPLPR